MSLEPGTGPHPEEPVQDFKLSMIGLVTKTIDLWVKKLLKYASIMLVPAALVIVLDLAVLYVLLGSDAISKLAEISSNPVSVILNLLLSPESVSLSPVVSVGLGVLGLVVYTVAAGAAIKFTLDGYGSSQVGNVKSSFSFAFSRLSVLIGVQLALSLITSVVALPLLIGLSWFLLTFDPENPYSIDMNLLMLVFILMLVLLPIMIYISVRFVPLLAVPIAEEHGIIGSLKRAWALTHGKFWHVFGAQFILNIIGGIIGSVIGSMGSALLYAGEWIVTPAVTILSVLIVGPLDYVFVAVLIKDLQPRAEARTQEYW